MRTSIVTVLLFNILLLNISHGQQINPTIFTTKVTAEGLRSESTDKIYLLGLGSIDAPDLNKVQSSGSLALAIKSTRALTTFLSYNLGANISKTHMDSISVSSFLFPDVANSVFMGSIAFDISEWYFDGVEKIRSETNLSHWIVKGEWSFQHRNVSNDSAVISKFDLGTIGAGAQYKWIYVTPKYRSAFSLGLYYTYFGITKNTKVDFKKIYGIAGHTPINYHGYGLESSMQINDLIFSFRFADILSGPGTRFNGISYTIGAKFVGDIFSF